MIGFTVRFALERRMDNALTPLNREVSPLSNHALADLVACPQCDTLHRLVLVAAGQKARCRRCHSVLMSPHASAMTKIVMLALTATVLMIAAITFPFLTLEARGLTQRNSVIDAILAFSSGLMLPLSLAIAGLIVVLPLMRLAAILYVLAPMAIGWAPAKGAMRAFRFAQVLKPWAMAEIFIVGVAVALVKVAGLAILTIGPAFWAFTALVLVTVLNDNFMCRLTIWRTLEARRPHL
ncbi:paraquat-inducible protein A [Cypionkella aquatica]|uniref:paraquat-inducible protein A n=1 Tax=Cypionkella aquatica TaxID=1756042 RepID=UPI0024E12EC7|nr:paraquat-inducible protein A [Cypionkella aquatica]